MANVAVIAVGNEVVRGDVIDTNGAQVARWALAAGLEPGPRWVVPDDEARIAEAVARAASEADVVVVVGGLGPTPDDVTRDGVARAAGRPLVRHAEAEARLRALYSHRGLPLSAGVLRQADLPAGASLLPNDVGTAPGFWLEERGVLIVVLPGPPRELIPMGNHVMALWRARFPEAAAPPARRLFVAGYGESVIAERVAATLGAGSPSASGVRWATYLHAGTVEVRLWAQRSQEGLRAGEAESAVAEAAARVREALAPWVYSEEEPSLSSAIASLALRQGRRVAVAESCSGGAVAAALSGVPGASRWFAGGVVAYQSWVKERVLGVDRGILDSEGAVSAACAEAMARGARASLSADVVVAVTGYAGPDGGDERNPVGTVYVGWSDSTGQGSVRRVFHGPRHAVRERATWEALVCLWARLSGLAPPS